MIDESGNLLEFSMIYSVGEIVSFRNETMTNELLIIDQWNHVNYLILIILSS
jgi:hypothetical protein